MIDFPKWQLHRGFWKEGVRENTMEAFRQAKKMNCTMVELDAQLSRDGIFHVFHDFSLKRFFHVDQKISRTSSDDLSGLSIPRLQEVLESDEVPEFLNIEVKTRSLIGYREASKLLDELTKFGAQKRILISSFNPMVLMWLKWLNPTLHRALIVGKGPLVMSRRFDFYVKISDPQFINCHYSLIDDEVSREHLLYFARPLMIWTVNEHSKAQFYLSRGAKSIISDLPPRTKVVK